MQHLAAVMTSLDLLRVPTRVKLMRKAPLPEGTVTLLRIASGDNDLTKEASVAAASSPAAVREAAAFYIEQVMLHPEADSYRVLGVTPNASSEELRRNMALLLRWLHPDRVQEGRSIFTHRVTRAWNDLKSGDRRAAYDRSRSLALTERSLSRKKGRSGSNGHQRGRRPTTHPVSAQSHHSLRAPEPSGLFRKMLLLLLGRESH